MLGIVLLWHPLWIFWHEPSIQWFFRSSQHLSDWICTLNSSPSTVGRWFLKFFDSSLYLILEHFIRSGILEFKYPLNHFIGAFHFINGVVVEIPSSVTQLHVFHWLDGFLPLFLLFNLVLDNLIGVYEALWGRALQFSWVEAIEPD
jgi:hypothetical protein